MMQSDKHLAFASQPRHENVGRDVETVADMNVVKRLESHLDDVHIEAGSSPDVDFEFPDCQSDDKITCRDMLPRLSQASTIQQNNDAKSDASSDSSESMGYEKCTDDAKYQTTDVLTESDETAKMLLVHDESSSMETCSVVSNGIAADTGCHRAGVNTIDDGSKKSDEFVHMMSNYNEASAAQQHGADLVCGYLPKLVADSLKMLPKGSSLHVVEFGCATGGSSIAPLKVIENVVADKVKMVMTFNDLPLNNWDVLKATVEPNFDAVTFKYCKNSMYEGRVAPPGTLHIGYSVYAQHWLNGGCPCALPGGAMWASQLPSDHPLRAAWARASKTDWDRFLQLRAEEFAAGGHLIVHIQAANVDGGLEEKFADTMAAAKASLLADGILTVEEARGMCLPEYAKTPAEVLEPLLGSASWKLVDFHFSHFGCPYAKKVREEKYCESEVIKESLACLKAFCNSSLLSAASSHKVEQFWTRVSELARSIDSAEHNYAGIVVALRRL